jgi:hypothetical protein
MISLDIKINEIKNNLVDKNIKAIRNNKLKKIKYENIKKTEFKDEILIKEYNYYIRLIKKIKKYIKNQDNRITILDVENKENKIFYIVITVDIQDISIGIPIKINIITGDTNYTYMDCTYYERKENSVLYINDFTSIKPNKGYGGILLKKLDYIISEINKKIRTYNFKEIKTIEGKMIANKNVISEKSLKKLYIKYGFEIDNKNNMKRNTLIIE